MRWEIVYYNEKIKEEIFNLPDGLLARFIRLTDIMQEFGPDRDLQLAQLRMKEVKKNVT